MLMASTLPSKDIDWQTRFKRKAQECVIYKKPTSKTETNIGLG
jgi:hypothetical protein